MAAQYGALGAQLRDRVEILALARDEGGNYNWAHHRLRWADVTLAARNNIFSTIGTSVPGVEVVMRPHRDMTLERALRWKGQFLLPTALFVEEGKDRVTVQTAMVQPVTLTAKPQAVRGRDELNRPTLIRSEGYTFPGILTELYRRNDEDGAAEVEQLQRALVAPKAVQLRRGDVVSQGEGHSYVVRQVLDLAEYRNEYRIEAVEDA